MATYITEDCINCGACEPECPNAAIYQGGAEWDLDGVKQPAITADIFFIVPEKCTECVGFHDKEACAVVCPVDCCVPDPDRPESESALLERAKKLHPERIFAQDFPSRFRQPGVTAAASEPKPAAVATPAPTAADPIAAKAVTKPAPPPTTPVGAAKPAATATPVPAAPVESKAAVARAPEPSAPTPAAAATAASKPPPQPGAEQSAVAAEERPTATTGPTVAGPDPTPEPATAADEKPKVARPALPDMDEWEIPVDCFHCHRSYTVRFKHFRSGVVLRCPSCKGSYVVTTTMHGQVRRQLQEFHQQCRRELEAVRQAPPQERAELESRQRQAVERFGVALKALRAEQKAPGVPHQRAGIFG
jgi:ferredoxin